MDRTSDTPANASSARHGQIGIVRCNEDLVIIDASLSLCRFLARRRDELVGQSLLTYIDGDDLAVLTGQVCRSLMGERLDATTVDLHFLDRRGGPHPARLTLTWIPLPDAGFVGSVVAFGRTGAGPTAGQTAGVDLADRAPDLIWRLRLWPEPNFEYVSPSSMDLLGFPPSAFYGDPHLLGTLAAEPEDQAKVRALYDGQWNPHEPMVLHLTHRDGGVRALEQRTTGILDGERRVLAIEAISRDISGRQGAEAELVVEAAARRLLDRIEAGPGSPEAVLQRAIDVVCVESGWAVGHGLVVDDDDPEALRTTHVWSNDDNRFSAFRQSTTGRRWPTEGDLAESSIVTGEAAATSLTECVHGERARAAAASGLQRVLVVPVPLRDSVWAALEFYADDDPSEDAARQALLERIMPQVGQIIERGLEVQSLRRLDEARTEFVTRAAHELRGPVGSIAVMASALALEARRSGAVDLSGSLERLATQAERIQLMATRLLALSQLEEGRLEISLDAVALREAVEHAAGNLYPSTSPVTIDVDSNLKVLADPLILDELLANLLANAERHGGPHIGIEAVSVPIAGRESIEITVSDDGLGVDESLVPLLFEPLRRGLTSPTHSGLGLALVRQMALTLGGDVRYEPAQPNGARFTVTLSLA